MLGQYKCLNYYAGFVFKNQYATELFSHVKLLHFKLWNQVSFINVIFLMVSESVVKTPYEHDMLVLELLSCIHSKSSGVGYNISNTKKNNSNQTTNI